jgi:hypothetical protein
MVSANINRTIDSPNNKLVTNKVPVKDNGCNRRKHKVPFMIYHQNIRSLQSKIDELLSMWCDAYPHVLCLSEHHLRNQEISMLRCSPYLLAATYCRSISKSGGVCIHVHESLSFTAIDLNKYCKEHDFGVCAVKLYFMSVTYCVVSIYRSPTGKIPYFISALDSVLNKLHSTSTNLILWRFEYKL